MNTELETWKERQTKWIENGYKPEEPTIKVSELREWCEKKMTRVLQERKGLSFNDDREDVRQLDGMKEILNSILNQFCKEAK